MACYPQRGINRELRNSTNPIYMEAPIGSDPTQRTKFSMFENKMNGNNIRFFTVIKMRLMH